MTVEAIFKNTPYSMPPKFDGTVVIYKEWPQWQKDMWYGVLGAPPPALFAPTYEPVHTVTGLDGIPRILNIFNFATMETAQWLMQTFAADHVASVPYLGVGVGGPEVSDARELWLVWPDGLAINAGELAEYYTNNANSDAITPESAKAAVQGMIDTARASVPMPTLPKAV